VLSGLSRKTWIGIRNMVRCRLRRTDLGAPDDLCGYPVYRNPHGLYNLRRAAAELLRAFEPHVVVAQHHDAVGIAEMARQAGIPAAVYVHSSDLPWVGLRSKMIKYRFKFLANSRYIAERLQREYGIAAPVIYNLFDPARYTPAIPREIPPRERLFATFINPHPLKGDEIVLRLAETNKHIPFLFVGGWLQHRPDKAFRQRVRAAGNITWTRTTTDMRQVYAQTKVLLVPSQIEETWGRVVTEAQFSGIPVLAANRGGLPESVGPGGVMLPDDVYGWEAALRMIWRDGDYWQAVSDKARQHAARDEIKPENVITRFVDEIGRR
jgi:glycosyltransferase involved in cell wall biosynthesis